MKAQYYIEKAAVMSLETHNLISLEHNSYLGFYTNSFGVICIKNTVTALQQSLLLLHLFQKNSIRPDRLSLTQLFLESNCCGDPKNIFSNKILHFDIGHEYGKNLKEVLLDRADENWSTFLELLI